MPNFKIRLLAHTFVSSDRMSEADMNLNGILKNPKNLKFMAKQDQLAVFAAHQVLSTFQLSVEELAQKLGIYLCVGNLAFEEKDLLKLATRSEKDGAFCMANFATDALLSINPLMTFRCLPNMPVFHISNNFGIHSTYFITYPSRFQWAQALNKACLDLNRGKIEYALVGAVADQRNPLTRSYLEKRGLTSKIEVLDVAGMWLLTTKDIESSLWVDSIEINYSPDDFPCDQALEFSGPYMANAAEYANVESWVLNSSEEKKTFAYREGAGSYSLTLSKGPV